MSTQPVALAVEQARRDLRSHTLARLDGDFAKLVYLASTRSYNTGRYAHEGLALQYSESVAAQALAAEHRDVFHGLALGSLRELVNQLVQYLRCGGANAQEILSTWKELQPYRILPPAKSEALTVRLFLSNVRVALAMAGPAVAADHPVPHPQSG
jgi:hypothetical protein